MLERWFLRATLGLWAGLVGPIIGFIAGQRLIGPDCQLSPTAGGGHRQRFFWRGGGAAGGFTTCAATHPTCPTYSGRSTYADGSFDVAAVVAPGRAGTCRVGRWLHNRYRPDRLRAPFRNRRQWNRHPRPNRGGGANPSSPLAAQESRVSSAKAAWKRHTRSAPSPKPPLRRTPILTSSKNASRWPIGRPGPDSWC